ncbi:hypothetical protein M8J77_011974 [Diaphorina citri]|nr:hypothetical protein M8J77_011974 [Diaphorina citri]
MYNQATCKIRVGEELTGEIKISKGLITGDTLSPILFSLFTADLVTFLRDKGFTGIQVSQTVDVFILMYADDLVLMGHSKIDLQKKINALKEYCDLNDLEVNTQKTKIVVFRKKGRLAAQDIFYYNGQQLEVVPDFVYLGVKFSSSGLFRKHMEQAISKAKIALSNIKTIMVNSKMESWEGRIHLFETIVKVTLLYSGEVWTLRYSEEIERCQVQFFKTILLLKYNTPNHYIRLETGRLSLAHSVLKMSLKWLIKTQELPEYRLPKLCYQKLKLMDETYPNGDVRYNWCTQLKHLMREMGEENINLENVKQNVDEILARAGEKIFQVDRERLRASTYNENYKKIKSVNTLERENYLAYRVPIERTRVICQLRTLGTTICVFLNGEKIIWDTTENCSICNLNLPENLEHIFIACPQYEVTRRQFLNNYIYQNLEEENQHKIQNILRIESVDQMNRVYFFIKSMVKRRKFLRNE